MIDEALIFHYLDGEIDDATRLRVEQEIAADPDLQAMVDEHRALAARLDRAFLPILTAPVPLAMSAKIAADSNVISLADERARQQRRRVSQDFSRWAAMAAILVAGVFGGVMFNGQHSGLVTNGAPPVTDGGSQLTASGQLNLALNTQLASTQGTKEPVRIGLTFRNHSGAICRTFSAQATDGVACRDGNAWQLKGLIAHGQTSTGDYRMAASSGTTELVGALITGEALDQAQERAALATNWAPSK